MIIDRFFAEYGFLSNFYPSPITFAGIEYPTVEHAYQASKTLDEKERVRISKLKMPGQAKSAGQKVTLRPDWENVKWGIMFELVRLKFETHEDLREKLLATGDAKLIEGNRWGDTYWGVDVVRGGLNQLGEVLMRVRTFLLKEQKREDGRCV